MHADDLLTPFAIYLRICHAKTASLCSSKVTQFSVLLNGGRGSGSKRKFSAMAADEQACRLCRQNLGNLINLTTLACGCHFHTRCFATQMFFSHMTKEGGDADTQIRQDIHLTFVHTLGMEMPLQPWTRLLQEPAPAIPGGDQVQAETHS